MNRNFSEARGLNNEILTCAVICLKTFFSNFSWRCCRSLKQLLNKTNVFNCVFDIFNVIRGQAEVFTNGHGLLLLPHQVRTQRRFGVPTTSSQRLGRCTDVETTLCTNRAGFQDRVNRIFLIINESSLYAHNVVSTSIQHPKCSDDVV